MDATDGYLAEALRICRFENQSMREVVETLKVEVKNTRELLARKETFIVGLSAKNEELSKPFRENREITNLQSRLVADGHEITALRHQLFAIKAEKTQVQAENKDKDKKIDELESKLKDTEAVIAIKAERTQLQVENKDKTKKINELEARLANAEIKLEQNLFKAECQIKDKKIVELEDRLAAADIKSASLKNVFSANNADWSKCEADNKIKDKKIVELENQLTEIKEVVEAKSEKMIELESQKKFILHHSQEKDVTITDLRARLEKTKFELLSKTEAFDQIANDKLVNRMAMRIAELEGLPAPTVNCPAEICIPATPSTKPIGRIIKSPYGELKDELEVKNKKIAELENKLVVVKKDRDDQFTEIKNVLETERSVKDKKIAELKEQLAAHKQEKELKARNAPIGQQRDVIAAQMEHVGEKDDKIIGLEEKLALVTAENAKSDAQISRFIALVKEYGERFERETAMINQQKDELKAKDKKIIELESQLAKLNIDCDKAKESSDHFALRVVQCHYAISDNKAKDDKISELEAKVFRVRELMNTKDHEITKLNKLISEHKSEPILTLTQEREQHAGELETMDKKINALEDQKKQLENGLMFSLSMREGQLETKDKKIAALEDQKKQLENKLMFSRSNLKYKENEVNDLKIKISDNKSEPSLMLIQERKQHKEIVDAKDKKITELENQQKSESTPQLIQLIQERKQHKEIVDAKDIKIVELETQIKQLQSTNIDALRKQIDDKNTLIESQRTNMTAILKSNDNKRSNIWRLENQISRQEIELRWRQEDINAVKKSINAKDETIDWQRNEIVDMMRKIEHTTPTINMQKHEIDSLKNQLADKNTEDKDATISQQKTEIDELKKQIEKTEDKDATISQQKDVIDALKKQIEKTEDKDATISQQKTEIDELKIKVRVLEIEYDRKAMVLVERSRETSDLIEQRKKLYRIIKGQEAELEEFQNQLDIFLSFLCKTGVLTITLRKSSDNI